MRHNLQHGIEPGLRTDCLELARSISSTYSAAPPPFDLSPLAERYGVHDISERLMDRDAHLISEGDKLVIEVNRAVSGVRRRMSIAHEFAHLIIAEVEGRWSQTG